MDALPRVSDGALHPAVREVIELHDFFIDWLTAAVPDTDESFSRFERATAPAFALVTTDGVLMERIEVTEWIRQSYGTRPGFRHWTTDHQVRYDANGTVLVTYWEWQEWNRPVTCRTSSAWFVADAGAPNGLSWLHIHETWLAPQ